ncbi:MAG: chromate transporter [Acidisphaera sp.]|nr:chromate transporter [Acidisphaera sp.]
MPLQPVSLSGLFGGFFSIGLSGFGGVLPWARRMIVEQRRWLTGAEFTDLLALCQFLPGPNTVNLSVALGARFHGARGAVLAFLGLMAAPMAIVIGLGVVYGRFAGVPAVQHGFQGLAAAASGLVIATALKIAAPLRRDPPGLAVAALAFLAIAVLRLPLLPALVVLVPASVLLAAARRRR